MTADDHLIGHAADGRTLVIRRAIPADQLAVATNINAVCRERIYLQSDAFVPTQDWGIVLGQEALTDARRLLVVAEVDGIVVGHSRIFPVGFGHKDRHVADVGIALLAPFRGIHIGSQLLESVISRADTMGYTKLVAAVIARNQRALRLFMRLGFVQEGNRRHQYRIEDQYVDEILLGRFLGDG